MLSNRALCMSFNNLVMHFFYVFMCNNIPFITNNNETQTTIEKKTIICMRSSALLHDLGLSNHSYLHSESLLTLSIAFLYFTTLQFLSFVLLATDCANSCVFCKCQHKLIYFCVAHILSLLLTAYAL